MPDDDFVPREVAARYQAGYARYREIVLEVDRQCSLILSKNCWPVRVKLSPTAHEHLKEMIRRGKPIVKAAGEKEFDSYDSDVGEVSDYRDDQPLASFQSLVVGFLPVEVDNSLTKDVAVVYRSRSEPVEQQGDLPVRKQLDG